MDNPKSAPLLNVHHETFERTPSPLTERKLYDFLTVNGIFIKKKIQPSSNASTRTSSLSPSPIPSDTSSDIDEPEKVRRMSLSSDIVDIQTSDEFNVKHELSKKAQRRYSLRTTELHPTSALRNSSESTVISWAPIHCVKNLNNKMEKNKITSLLYGGTSKSLQESQINNDENGNPTNNKDNCGNFYPNCDVNVWLRSCEKEIIDPINGVLKGEIPKWLNGSLLRNGPGNLHVGEMRFDHLFDASALLHRFSIQNGVVKYQCRFLKSQTYKKNLAAKRIVVAEFGTTPVPDPCQSIFQRISSIFTPGECSSDNAMISVYPFGDEYFVFTESPVIHKINPVTLDTEQRLNLSNYVGIVNHTSHPHVMADGTVFNLGMSITKTGPEYNIICFPNGENMFENAHIVGRVPARWKINPSYMHTFGITENYFIIVEQPLTVYVPSIIKTQLTNKSMASSLKWFPDKETYIYLLDRLTNEIKFTFRTDSFFYLHIINQYEIENYVIIDICCYKDPSMLNCMYIDTMKDMQNNPDYADMFRGKPLRFVLPLNTKYSSTTPVTQTSPSNDDSSEQSFFSRFSRKSGFKKVPVNDNPSTKKQVLCENLVKLKSTKATAYKFPNDKIIFCTPELLCDLGCETPRIHYEKYLGKSYRYFYAISSDVDAEFPGTLIKVDVVTKTRKTWSEYNCYPSEPVFVPSPNSKSEDDGVILTAMVWGNDNINRVGLLVLCAVTWQELGRCEFETQSPVPKCLHGWFVKKSY